MKIGSIVELNGETKVKSCHKDYDDKVYPMGTQFILQECTVGELNWMVKKDEPMCKVFCEWKHLRESTNETSAEVPTEQKVMETTLTTVSESASKFLNADTKALIEAGYLDAKLEVTPKATKKLASFLFDYFQDKLIEAAKSEVKAAKKSAKPVTAE